MFYLLLNCWLNVVFMTWNQTGKRKARQIVMHSFRHSLIKSYLIRIISVYKVIPPIVSKYK